MTGQIRRLYFAVGLIAFLLLTLALVVAAMRSAPESGRQEKLDGIGYGPVNSNPGSPNLKARWHGDESGHRHRKFAQALLAAIAAPCDRTRSYEDAVPMTVPLIGHYPVVNLVQLVGRFGIDHIRLG